VIGLEIGLGLRNVVKVVMVRDLAGYGYVYTSPYPAGGIFPPDPPD